MSGPIVGRLVRPSRLSPLVDGLPNFLLPSLILATPASFTPSSRFSTSPQAYVGRSRLAKDNNRSRTRDNNANRGVSAIRATGPREPLSVSKEQLPVPVLDPKKRSKVPVSDTHGLWGFFNKKKTVLSTPEEDYAHGK
jgi:large subunit ribosomal protein L47